MKKSKIHLTEQNLVDCQTIEHYIPWGQHAVLQKQQEIIPTHRKEIIQNFLHKVINHKKYLSKPSPQKKIKTCPDISHNEQKSDYDKKSLQKNLRLLKKSEQLCWPYKTNMDIQLEVKNQFTFPKIIKVSKQKQIGLCPQNYSHSFVHDKKGMSFNHQMFNQYGCKDKQKIVTKQYFAGSDVKQSTNNARECYQKWVDSNKNKMTQIFTSHNKLMGNRVRKTNKKCSGGINRRKLKSLGHVCKNVEIQPIFQKILHIQAIRKHSYEHKNNSSNSTQVQSYT